MWGVYVLSMSFTLTTLKRTLKKSLRCWPRSTLTRRLVMLTSLFVCSEQLEIVMLPSYWRLLLSKTLIFNSRKHSDYALTYFNVATMVSVFFVGLFFFDKGRGSFVFSEDLSSKCEALSTQNWVFRTFFFFSSRQLKKSQSAGKPLKCERALLVARAHTHPVPPLCPPVYPPAKKK